MWVDYLGGGGGGANGMLAPTRKLFGEGAWPRVAPTVPTPMRIQHMHLVSLTFLFCFLRIYNVHQAY